MADKIIYQLQDLRKSYGQDEILKGITLSFLEGAKIGVIGRNGAGKSTLFQIIAGVDTQFEGTAKGIAGLTIGYLSQEPQLDDTMSVAENLELSVAPIRNLVTRYNEVAELMGTVTDDDEMMKLADEMTALDEQIVHKDAWNLDSQLEQAGAALCLPPMEAEAVKLSGGERRRVALCMLLLSQPDMLLLDEPTNHLDAETVEWLEKHLAEYQGMVLLITHDRYFLDNVVDWILEIDRGLSIPWKGNYSQYLEQKSKTLDTKKQADARTEKMFRRELEWKNRTPAARMKRAKARLSRFKELQNVRPEAQMEEVDLRIPPGPRLGDKVIDVRDLKKGFGDRTLIDGLSFSLPPGGILGIIGANGMGKSTLLKMILDKETPDEGEVSVGSTVEIVYLDQSRLVLDDDDTVYNNITEGNELIPYGGKTLDGRAYVARFNFRGDDQSKLLRECSGGMRNRVLLAKMLRVPANVILLDEPTNDLDLETLRVLEGAIAEYPGSAIVVSHDRYFLNRICTHILSFEGLDANGHPEVNFFPGDYEAYTDWRKTDRERRGIGPGSRARRYRRLIRQS
jgi:ATP-binding cassette ChvD family protein